MIDCVINSIKYCDSYVHFLSIVKSVLKKHGTAFIQYGGGILLHLMHIIYSISFTFKTAVNDTCKKTIGANSKMAIHITHYTLHFVFWQVRYFH